MAGDYRFPNWPCIPTKPAVFDDRSLVRESIYMAKCKRRRSDGATPCYCCPGQCVGEPVNVAQDDAFIRDFEARMTPAQTPHDCPWSWAATLAVVAFIVGMHLCRGVFW